MTGFGLAVEIGSWSNRPGTTGPGIGSGTRCWIGGHWPTRPPGPAGNRRVHRQWERFIARNERGTIATIAIARELVVGRPQPVQR